jgi:hypothetical protein
MRSNFILILRFHPNENWIEVAGLQGFCAAFTTGPSVRRNGLMLSWPEVKRL